jgi:hypothetical protein
VGEYLCTLILGTAVLGIEKKGQGQAGQLSVGARVLQVEREAHPPLWAQRRQPDDNPHNHRTHHYPPSKVCSLHVAPSCAACPDCVWLCLCVLGVVL